jgi:hypothetical protein
MAAPGSKTISDLKFEIAETTETKKGIARAMPFRR